MEFEMVITSGDFDATHLTAPSGQLVLTPAQIARTLLVTTSPAGCSAVASSGAIGAITHNAKG
jgi:hypothetical protein